jgi:cytochrome c-type biogenesis protein CcmH
LKAFAGFALLMILSAVGTVAWPMLRQRRGVLRKWAPVALAGILIPAIALSLYATLSNWTWGQAASPATASAAIEKMVGSLEARLQGNPMDVSGWLMLGRSRFQLGQYSESAAAFQKAYSLTQGKNVDAVLGLGEALAFAEEGMLLGQASVLFDQGYALAPSHPKALWYTGVVAYQAGRLDVARERWSALIALNPPEQVRRLLENKIIEIEAALLRAQASDPATPAPLVKVRVSVAPGLGPRAGGNSPLFVLVRKEEGGPPLAVTRRAASELPALIELSDQDVMIAGRNLSGAGKVTVVARIARSGEPVARSGDLEGSVSYDVGSQEAVDLIIDSVVP